VELGGIVGADADGGSARSAAGGIAFSGWLIGGVGSDAVPSEEAGFWETQEHT
jgi:hypothetical protein